MKSKLWGIQCSFSAIFSYYITSYWFCLFCPPPFSNLFFELMTKFFKLAIVNIIATFSNHLFKVFVEKSRQFLFPKKNTMFLLLRTKTKWWLEKYWLTLLDNLFMYSESSRPHLKTRHFSHKSMIITKYDMLVFALFK